MNSSSNSNRTILLVDDDRLVLATLAKGLAVAGYSINTAESADDAEAMLASGERPDLVILDVCMPHRSGLEFAERLRLFDHVPFILLSAYSDHSFVEQAAVSGALSYLVKPVDTRQLVPVIEAALARAKEFQGLRTTGQQLQNALDSEREISVAIGITMVQYRLGRKAAFEKLRKAARSQRRKLVELAIEVVNASETLNLEE